MLTYVNATTPVRGGTRLVPPGLSTATFVITGRSVNVVTTAAIRATFGAVTRSANLNVVPPISSVVVSPALQMGGGATNLKIVLPYAAPAGGTVVTLTSSASGIASVPASATVPAGITYVIVPVTVYLSHRVPLSRCPQKSGPI